jgi:peptidoglycan/LPS O-acetylase OafA/YrhL
LRLVTECARVLNQAGSSGGYRPDLDGLRAIAVAAVVGYHLDLPFAPGGFVGVDIFFVLSGFLITRIIAFELQEGRFSVARFYERRIRRIVPALVFVCACTTMLAVAFLLPDELKRYASTLMATAFSISNIWFFENSNYFDPSSGTQPLLHTWSLGIEEQFYIVFPLLLMAVFRWWPRALSKVVWLAFAGSLAASVILMPQHQRAAFFLLHARAWELLSGAIVALKLIPRPTSRAQREIAVTLGLGAIAVAMFGYSSKTLFPGATALLPCIGTAMAIWAGDVGGGSERAHAVGTRVLSFRPLVLLGLVSYSLYLWHWPLIVFAKLATPERFDLRQQMALAVVALALAVATWHFVEQPFRRRGAGEWTPRTIFKGSAIGLGGLAAFAFWIVALAGVPQRFPEAVLQIAAAQADASPLRDKCHFHAGGTKSYDDTCIIGDEVAPSVIVYGDSHGAEFSAALGEFAKSRHASIRQITASGCPPAMGFTFPQDPQCERYNTAIIARLKAISPTTIVLATYSLAWDREYPDKFWPSFERTITTLRAAGHRVIVVGPVPDMQHVSGIPAAVARWTAKGGDPNDFTFKMGAKQVQSVETHLAEIASAQGAIFVPVSAELCADRKCRPYTDGAVLYFDNNHLSMSGAQLIASRLLVPVIWPEPEISRLNVSVP